MAPCCVTGTETTNPSLLKFDKIAVAERHLVHDLRIAESPIDFCLLGGP